jgi:hypothetical protein
MVEAAGVELSMDIDNTQLADSMIRTIINFRTISGLLAQN